MMTFLTSTLSIRARHVAALVGLLMLFVAAPAFARGHLTPDEAMKIALEQREADQKAKPTPAKRSPGEVSELTQQISEDIYSPFCPGETIAICPSGGASIVRQHIQKLAREGKSKHEIEEAIFAKYGDEFRRPLPPKQDDYVLIALLAVVFVFCMVLIFFIAVRRRRNASDDDETDEESTSAEISPEERLYLEELRGEYLD